ncbi:Uncharacterised protein [Bordetella ansorpii]|uniref:Uncharacterized protein n=1 Tax=Bordetella ansorpii TaxID=288768 RepID=A0A157RLQ1_9BORD|nr:hypothetical protein [Bordetella ansorpii]SAI58922.1 Uncharacterised protein [Bordetella ansorpii]
MDETTQDAAQPDPYAGQGGSYTFDPATGQRTLVARTNLCVGCNDEASGANASPGVVAAVSDEPSEPQ